ncbi:SigE family RNA polymerase sigma factor [Promicromonospora sp. MEB111]|uniref:SigE family RNA polymerase sigma factor n=1 Tax=Promicromonospora sp. MEB111 TaxID=3040301 RepID=UPI00254A88B8|nr:SigE family RNA polymerase sigma factor [Promicromonospora sp. MEB111]
MGNLGTGEPSGEDRAGDVQVFVRRSRDAEFTEFVRECGPYLHRTAYLLCGDPHRAEELVQSTFERVYRTWAKVRPGTQRAYARQILVNLRIDGWRRTRRESFPGDDKIPVTPASDHAGHVVLRDELVRGLARLPVSQRRVVVLRHLLDLPEAEVARELGIAVGTVKAANSRGLARLRDLLVAQTEAVEPVELDEQAVLDRSRAALRRRRVRQAVGAACVVLLLALGVVTRGPVPLPWVGPVVLPGGDLIVSLFDNGRAGPTDGLAPHLRPDPGPDLAGSTPLACPEELPAPTSARAAEPGEDVGPLDGSLVVDVADARPLTCYDVDIETVTPGRIDEQAGVPVTDDGGKQMPPLDGLAENGDIWAAGAEFGPAGTVEGAFVKADAHRSDGPTESIPTDTINDVMLVPYDVAARGDQVTWGETTGGEGPTRTSQIRTFRAGTEPRTLATYEGNVGEVALTRDHALWTDGAPEDEPRLLSTSIDGPGTPVVLADPVTAFAADDDEVVAAVLEPGSGDTRTTTIWLLDSPAGGNLSGSTALLSIEHGPADRIPEVAVSDDLVAWTTVSDEQGTTLFVLDRRGGVDSVVRAGDNSVNGLRAAGGLLLWNSADDENPVGPAYLYRATPSTAGYDGPDLAQLPGDTERANLAGDRIVWGEGFVPRDAVGRAWIVEGAVTPTLARE